MLSNSEQGGALFQSLCVFVFQVLGFVLESDVGHHFLYEVSGVFSVEEPLCEFHGRCSVRFWGRGSPECSDELRPHHSSFNADVVCREVMEVGVGINGLGVGFSIQSAFSLESGALVDCQVQEVNGTA